MATVRNAGTPGMDTAPPRPPSNETAPAGVARPWCGATGQKDNRQAGVFLGYARRTGAPLLDRRL